MPQRRAPAPAATVAPVATAGVAPVAGGSVAPVALATLRPPAPPDEPAPKRRRSRRKAAAVGLISGALVALGGYWSLRNNVERAGVAALYAVAEDGSAVHDVRILVDGVERCASSPCAVTGLARGSHLASVVAPGYEATASRAFTVQAGEPANVSFELVRIPQPQQERVAAATEESHTALPAAPVPDSQPASTPKTKQRSAAKLAKPTVAKIKPATGQATLSFQSAPRANVVLDGRPIGKTPLAGVSVAPGAHNIVFIGADGRRKAQVANVTAGSKRAIVAKF